MTLPTNIIQRRRSIACHQFVDAEDGPIHSPLSTSETFEIPHAEHRFAEW